MRFTSAVIVSPERPARDIHQIVEAIIEQLTALPGSRVRIPMIARMYSNVMARSIPI